MFTGVTRYQPGFYRCGGRGLREQHINRASTGVMTELRWRLQPGFYRCGPRLQGYLGRVFRAPLLDLLAAFIDIDRRRMHKKVCQPGFYRCDGDDAGIQAQI